jgi:hypothetical protein
MLVLAARRLASMILIMFVISVLLFVFFEGDKLIWRACSAVSPPWKAASLARGQRL